MTKDTILYGFINMGIHYEDDRIQFIDNGIIDILPNYCIPEWDNNDKWSIYLDDVNTDDYSELYNIFKDNPDKWSII